MRLLQKFETFTLASDAQPKGSFPPYQWKSPGSKGRKAVEQIWPGAAFTLYVKVSPLDAEYPCRDFMFKHNRAGFGSGLVSRRPDNNVVANSVELDVLR